MIGGLGTTPIQQAIVETANIGPIKKWTNLNQKRMTKKIKTYNPKKIDG